MTILFLIALLCMAAIAILTFLLVNYFVQNSFYGRENCPLKITGYLACIAAASVCLFVVLSEHKAKSGSERANADAEWRRNGCRVYKSECGAKHKYACERKTTLKGRVVIDDIVVETYPTC